VIKNLLKFRGKVTNSHDGPDMTLKQRKGSSCTQVLLKPELTYKRGKNLGGS
jgi:hypothetical protein